MENQDPNKVNVIPSWKPQLGMKFDDLDEAWHFWRYYGGRVGFSVRKRFTNRSKFDGVVTSCRYVCFKEGKKSADKRDNLTQIGRAEIRTDCQVRMSLTIDREVGNYEVYDLCLEHNHMLQLPEACHLLPSQRRISKVQAFENALISAAKQVKELLGACTTNAEERCHVQVTQTSNEMSSAAQVTQTSNELLSAARLKKKEVEKKGFKRKKGFLVRQHKRTRKTPSTTSARKEREDFSISQQEKEKVISQTSSVKKVVSKKSAKRAKPIPNEASSEKYEFMGSFTDLLTAPIVEDIDADPF